VGGPKGEQTFVRERVQEMAVVSPGQLTGWSRLDPETTPRDNTECRPRLITGRDYSRIRKWTCNYLPGKIA
jgi:hypothetical protein